jgi:hypothetical protein
MINQRREDICDLNDIAVFAADQNFISTRDDAAFWKGSRQLINILVGSTQKVNQWKVVEVDGFFDR